MASKCSSFFHQFGLGTLPPFSNARKFYSLRTKSNIQHRQEIRSENQSTCFFERELSAPKCSSFYHKSGLETLVTVGAVIERAQVLRTQNKPNVQHRHEIRSENKDFLRRFQKSSDKLNLFTTSTPRSNSAHPPLRRASAGENSPPTQIVEVEARIGPQDPRLRKIALFQLF